MGWVTVIRYPTPDNLFTIIWARTRIDSVITEGSGASRG